MTQLLTDIIKDAERYRWLRYGDNDERVMKADLWEIVGCSVTKNLTQQLTT